METIFRTLQKNFKSIGIEIEQDFEMTIHRIYRLHSYTWN